MAANTDPLFRGAHPEPVALGLQDPARGIDEFHPDRPIGRDLDIKRAVLLHFCLAQQTGGRFYEVSKKESIEQIYASIGEELRNQYSLGFTPDRAGEENGYHKILLTTTQKDLTVQARDGYYSGK